MFSRVKIKGNYIALPHGMTRFSIKKHNEHGKLKNIKFKVSHIWGEKRPSKKTRFPTMLGPATGRPVIGGVLWVQSRFKMQCGAVLTQHIFSKIPTMDTP